MQLYCAMWHSVYYERDLDFRLNTIAIYSCLTMNYLTATGSSDSSLILPHVSITTYSDTTCKVQLPSKSPPIIKRSLSCCLAPSPTPAWLLRMGRAAQAISHRAQRTERIKSKTLQKINQRRTCALQLQATQRGPWSSTLELPWFSTEKVISFYWRK